MSRFAYILAASLLMPAASASAANDELAIDGVRLQSSSYRSVKGGDVWEDSLIRPNASALSVYFHQLDLGDGDYLIVDNGVEERIYTESDGDGFWTEPMDGGRLNFTLVATPRSQGDGVVIDRYRADYTPDATSSIYQRNNLVGIADAPEDIYEGRGPTARVYMAGVGYCTGFMISNNLMMTNNHCLNDANGCSRTTAQFNYEKDGNGNNTQTDEYSCESVVETDYTLDYTIMRLSGTPGRTYGWYDLADRDPDNGEQGFIIQHPGGDRKQASVAPDCALGAVTGGNGSNSDFKHQCDTLGGSSGAPVFDEDFNVIGLHHFGGAGWIPRSANQAVRMSRILSQCDNCGN